MAAPPPLPVRTSHTLAGLTSPGVSLGMVSSGSEYLAFLTWKKANSEALATPVRLFIAVSKLEPAPTPPLPPPDALTIDSLASQTQNISLQATEASPSGGWDSTAVQPPTTNPAPPALSVSPVASTEPAKAVYKPPPSRSSTLVAQINNVLEPPTQPRKRPSDKVSWRPGAQADGITPPTPMSAGAAAPQGQNGAGWGQPPSPLAQFHTQVSAINRGSVAWGSPSTAPSTPLPAGEGGQGWGQHPAPAVPVAQPQTLPPPAQVQAPPAEAPVRHEQGAWGQPASLPSPAPQAEDAGGWGATAPPPSSTLASTPGTVEQTPGWGAPATAAPTPALTADSGTTWNTNAPASTPSFEQQSPVPANTQTQPMKYSAQPQLQEPALVQQQLIPLGREYVAWQSYTYTTPVQPVSEILEEMRRGRVSSFTKKSGGGSGFGAVRYNGYRSRGAEPSVALDGAGKRQEWGERKSSAVPIVAPVEEPPAPSGGPAHVEGGWGAEPAPIPAPTSAPTSAPDNGQGGWGQQPQPQEAAPQPKPTAPAPDNGQGGWGQQPQYQEPAPHPSVPAPTSAPDNGQGGWGQQPQPQEAATQPKPAAPAPGIHPSRLAMLGGDPRPSPVPPVDNYGPPPSVDSGRGVDNGWGNRANRNGGNSNSYEAPPHMAYRQPSVPARPPTAAATPTQTSFTPGSAPGIHPARLVMMGGGPRPY
ncbi:hypothetical protein L198_03521 [Cryptococcus wingfieldii CBS 7118]|uniref:Uncharacterized protein n=1 Tax=Cryptococcus wingfieldii CBS 7118 TaxID=1295528 RepID=A0A1E3JBM2_9TREE|nr:hypothetical protein L198_03521 [Cryptococcus wingfieldii CBS 7118]ODN98278.1 hypothetical protein L198_03521 [Cryptococcus wingfieldii CBS 7118]